jgi:hypothetical protein
MLIVDQLRKDDARLRVVALVVLVGMLRFSRAGFGGFK